MRVLLIGDDSLLWRSARAALAARNDLVAVVQTAGAGCHCDLLDLRAAAAATAGIDTVVQLVTTTGHPDLELIDLATRGTYNLLTTATSAQRYVQVTSLRTFERYPPEFIVNEHWQPRPTSAAGDLASYLAEVTAREVSRVLPLHAVTLRMGAVSSGGDTIGTDALHVEDATAAIIRACEYEPDRDTPRIATYHIIGSGIGTRFPVGLAARAPFSFASQHDVTAQRPSQSTLAEPTPTLAGVRGGAAHRVVILGAGGPLGAAVTALLAPDHTLRLSDVRPLREIADAGVRQSPGAPLPVVPGSPHAECACDVTVPEQVLAACTGTQAIVNCTVIRHDHDQAFRVNTLGAYNVMRAALATGIRRIVHTGPYQARLGHPAGYGADYDVSDDAPPRPGQQLYILTKYLGQEICRIFAEEHGLEVPTLLFSQFVAPGITPREPMGAFPLSVSWTDAAAAVRLALHTPEFPRPFEVFHINADLPHGRFPNAKAKRLLGWQPRDDLVAYYTRQEGT